MTNPIPESAIALPVGAPGGKPADCFESDPCNIDDPLDATMRWVAGKGK